MVSKVFIIENITNIHVGSGESNFGIIDNLVQRDTITKFPTIHSSSLKGALREAFSNIYPNDKDIYEIFGSDPKDANSKQGAMKFMQANLLSRPVRSSIDYYSSATSLELLWDFIETLNLFGKQDIAEKITNQTKIIENDNSKVISANEKILEDFKSRKNDTISFNILSEFLGKNPSIFDNTILKNIPLAVIARNQLENGLSKNLWYEEVVPRFSRFYFSVIMTEDNYSLNNKLVDFLTKNIFQVGANGSIGYGMCKITEVI